MGEGGSGREQRTFFIMIVYTDNVDYVHHEPAKSDKKIDAGASCVKSERVERQKQEALMRNETAMMSEFNGST